MTACRPARRAVPAAAAFVLSCAALAGCGGSGGPAQSAGSPPSSGGSSSPAGNASANTGKLTGNFCTDFKNIGENIPIPPSAAGSLATMEQHDGRYLRQVAAHYNKLAAEAPAQAGKEIRLIASAYQGMARSVTSGSTGSLNKLEQQMRSLTTSGAAGNAFKQLVTYVTTKCSST
jgi:hypothetical protein